MILWRCQGVVAWRCRGDSAAGGPTWCRNSHAARPDTSLALGWFNRPAFDVAESLIPFDAAAMPYWRALVVGLVKQSEGDVVGLAVSHAAWARPLA